MAMRSLPDQLNRLNCGCQILSRVRNGMAGLEFCPLHAAAPEMLEALKCADSWIDQVVSPTNEADVYYAIEKIRSAITKAEGKP